MMLLISTYLQICFDFSLLPHIFLFSHILIRSFTRFYKAVASMPRVCPCLVCTSHVKLLLVLLLLIKLPISKGYCSY